MNSLVEDYPEKLLAEHKPPCVSIYMPTHKSPPDNAQDPIRFRNLVKEAERSLRENYASQNISALLKPFAELAEDRIIWSHMGEGLAVFGRPEWFRVYRLQRPVTELSIVAESFHVKPLIRIVQSADSYQILGLSLNEFKVYEGNRDGVEALPPVEGVSYTAAELLHEDDGELDRTARVYGPSRAFTQHGTDLKQDMDKRDAERFFRAVDEAVMQHYSRTSGLPLILAALPEHHHLFRSVSRNPQLMSEAIDIHPDDLSLDALRERAWNLILPRYLEQLGAHLDAFGKARANGQGTDVLTEIASAAFAGRIATLLLEADRLVPGCIDASSGNITDCIPGQPGTDDLLDDFGEYVLKNGGEVIIVPAERMPTQTGAAAIYRF